MHEKLSKGFFLADEVLFIGYSRRHAAFSRSVYDAFHRSGADVYPVNPSGGDGEVPVYRSIGEVPARPRFAFVLTGKSSSARVVDELASFGVRRVLFNSPRSVDEATLDRCRLLGLETAVGCPMMAFGGGLHRLHGLLRGMR